MEERRFDDLTRTLGRATSRRQVLKGLLGGLGVTLLGRNSTPAAAQGDTCSSQQYQTCMADAKAEYDILAGTCKTTDGPSWFGQFCEVAVSAKYRRALLKCQLAQCAAGESCVDNRCCQGENCCQEGQIHCPDPVSGDAGGSCCPAGSTCCAGGCCPPENTCCLNFDLSFFNPSAGQVCTNLQTDPNNCGECRNKCDGLPCVDGACQCPPGEGLCAGPFNQTCCKAHEYCQAGAAGFVICVPICSECDTYDPNDTVQPCKPKECPACQECDPENGQCIPVAGESECGSGLNCCGGQCVDTTCSGQQTFNLETCQCECPQITCPSGQPPDPTTCECDCAPPSDGCLFDNMVWDPVRCTCVNECNFSPHGCGG